MNPPVKLADLTDALDLMPEESGAWLDRQTGRVMVVEESVIQAIESVAGDAVPAGVADWQAEQSAAARGIVEGDVRYLPLPDKFEFHEYRQMEQFIGSVADTQISARLWNAIKGKGAFRQPKKSSRSMDNTGSKQFAKGTAISPKI